MIDLTPHALVTFSPLSFLSPSPFSHALQENSRRTTDNHEKPTKHHIVATAIHNHQPSQFVVPIHQYYLCHIMGLQHWFLWFIKGSSKEKVEETPEYMPTSPSVDWDVVADEMAAGPDGQDSLDEDSLEDLTMSWHQGIGWTKERAACRSSQWEDY
jgi:hypothetical protein